MKKTIVLAFCITIISFSALAEGSSETPITKSELTALFRGSEKISNYTSLDILVSIGNDWTVDYRGDWNDLGQLEFESSGDSFSIKTKSSGFSLAQAPRGTLLLGVPSIRELRLQGSGDAVVDGVIRTEELNLISRGSGDIVAQARVEDFALSLTGSGSAELRVIAEESDLRLTGSGSADVALITVETEITTTGSGSVSIEGEAREAEIRITGSGSLDGFDFSVGNLDITLTGNGSSRVSVDGEIDATLTGTGGLTVSGPGRIARLRRTGTGRFEHLP